MAVHLAQRGYVVRLITAAGNDAHPQWHSFSTAASTTPLLESLAVVASSAKATVTEACRFVGQNAVQLHGGMGMTDELPIGHYFKRATQIEGEFGSADWHLARRARLG